MSNTEISSRLSFMAFGAEQRRRVAALKPQISALIGGALERFYSQARATPVTAAFFRDGAHMQKAKAAQQAHWLHIADGEFDDEFYQSVRRIGSVHARIGLEPRWYIGAYALVLEDLLRGLARKQTLMGRVRAFFGRSDAQEVSIAIMKAALLDMDLSVSIYFEQAQADRTLAVEKLTGALESLAKGDMSADLAGLPEAFAALEHNYNSAVANLRELIGSVIESTDQIRAGSGEIAIASEDLARRTESNAASLEETAASITMMDQRLMATAEAAAKTVQTADGAIATVSGGRSVADLAVQAMSRVSESAKGIDGVIEGLDKIAFQTRVLAMNAAVEAGRAGDAGRGFAVVADLVSALAMRAEEEAQRARSQLTVTQTDIVTAVEAVQKVDGALAEISGGVGQVHELLATMAADNQAQSSAINQISAAISSMDKSTQQNAAMVEETSAAARNLTNEVQLLSQQATRFQVRDSKRAHLSAVGQSKAAQSPLKMIA
ncbi:methyl-accepting chemotaxis protein [Novosphingobium sp. M1R2S20]|uniref:Methyl-accepting chemotaxis protein n=1 Tax=Novosphingobium rhizovicinum TaxID=3228928 RepID=A0ABV3RAA5_9SPHN